MNTTINIQLAPFQGITNRVFRMVYTSHFQGVDKLFTPFFTSIHKQKLSNNRSKELLSISENGIPVIPQILSKDADEILRFARYCKELGFEEINWNLGCPYPRVANKKRGSGMLSHPEMVESILDKIMPEMPVRFSIKMRLGYEHPDEIINLIPILNRFPLSEITIHARVGKQLYKGEVNHDAFAEVLNLSKHPVGYNGDIFTKNDFDQLIKQFPKLNILMLGRGLLADPFLPAHINDVKLPGLPEQKERINKFINDLYYQRRKQHNNGLQTLGNMKEYWWYLSYSFDNPHKVFSLIKKKKTFNDYEEAVKTVFDNYKWVGQSAGQFRYKNIEE